MKILDALNWRYATKKMNGTQVPQEKIDNILEAIRLAPTSMGIQPFVVYMIEDQKIKEQILSIANNQTQVVDGSHLLLFAAWDHLSQERIDEYVQRTAKERDLEESVLLPMKQVLQKIGAKTSDEIFDWAARQSYIALGFALTAAAVEHVDSTPMEGFNNSKLDELFSLREKGLRSVTLLPLGYRDEENDWLASMPKVRRSNEDLILDPEISLN